MRRKNEGEEINMEPQIYEVKLFCENCMKYQVVAILKGTTVEKYCADYICERCGCKTTRQAMYE
jgi:hypothetical protein